ncbi:hypothetical protein HZU77_016590 [Neisseriaceae bacterium TC5R-5]|nr:hypothetical protein [Neisseriaceae bacterium TC5R-5]
MAKASTSVTGTTNPTPGTSVCAKADCLTMWSLVQQFAYQRLSNRKIYSKTPQIRLINDYPVRAHRIAGTYARFYLEQERGGKPELKGRYYWMGLGAFASKTVAVTLEGWRLAMGDKASKYLEQKTGYTIGMIETMVEGLGKGNFWLFMDIAATHWYYNLDAPSFIDCKGARSTNNCVDEMQAFLKTLPWYPEAPNKANELKISKEIVEAFDLVAKIEKISTSSKDKKAKREIMQLKHLMIVAQHEQYNILQKIIYEDPKFADVIRFPRDTARGTARQAARTASPAFGLLPDEVLDKLVAPAAHRLERLISGELQLVFTPDEETDDDELKSVAPPGTKLEDYDSRMKWIEKAANKYHGLMIKRTKHMESALSTIASRYNKKDKDCTPDERPAADMVLGERR